MKTFLLAVFFAPTLVFAGNNEVTCRFSKWKGDHNQIRANVGGCSTQICMHVIKCGKYFSTVTCPAKNGVCDGYSASECKANATSETAKYATEVAAAAPVPAQGAPPRPPSPPPPPPTEPPEGL